MTAYYNENDPKAAAWLRDLIYVGAIAEGDVDERSIEDVRPVELLPYTQCHFFAGIGGWSYALRLAGVPDDTPVWTGSCPCQPFSEAGKRSGFADERHLWPSWLHLCRVCKPVRIFGEQVANALAWFDLVSADLEAEGYTVGAAIMGAHSVGAPHKRQRLYFVADSDRERQQERREPNGESRQQHTWSLTPTFWDSAGRCGPDAKGLYRPIEPGIKPLVDGVQKSLDNVLSFERLGMEVINAYAAAHETNPDQVLRMVQDTVHQEARWQRQDLGMRLEFSSPSILLNFLLCISSARDRTPERRRSKKESIEIVGRALRGVRSDSGVVRSSRGWQSEEQRQQKPPTSVFELSLVLARYAKSHREAAENAHAAINRVAMLRGFGNAIVPQCAAAFVKAYLECLN